MTGKSLILIFLATLLNYGFAHDLADFFTSDEYLYHQLDDFGVSVAGQYSIRFKVRACNDVHVLLMEDADNFQSSVYEIVIGGWQNTKSTIRKGQQGNNLVTADHAPLHCNRPRPFWVRWAGGVIEAGTGMTVGQDAFISFTDQSPTAATCNFVSVSTGYGATGHWNFFCGTNKRDCQDILDSGVSTSGVYTVRPCCDCPDIDIYCDMATDGGGWTVFQRRQAPGSVDFYRGWTDYQNGFGTLTGEHWLGLDNLHYIASEDNYELRIELEDFDGNTKFAKYGSFDVGSEMENYKLTVGGYDMSSDAGDSMAFHNGQRFSTKDRDNDVWSHNCAVTFEGAWWYRACHRANLNGRYLNGPHTSYANGINWKTWLGHYYSLKTTEMKIRRPST